MRILLVKTSSLGDVIHNLPVVSDLQRQFPEARIDWVVEENFTDLPHLHPAVGRVTPVAVRRWRKALLSRDTWQEMSAFRHTLQAVDYDVVVDTQGLVKSALITRTARLSLHGLRYGHSKDSAREPLAASFYDKSFPIDRSHHAVERNRELVAAALGYSDTLPNLPLDYGIQADGLQENWLPQGGYGVLLTATSRDDKLWPEAHWVSLGKALHAQGLPCVLPAGNPLERERAARLAAQIPSAVCAPSLGLKDLARLFAGASKVIGLDTGLTHLAAALHRPTVALFTGSNPGLTGVHAGDLAVNLGGIGQVPAVDKVLQTLSALPSLSSRP
ncbi:MAG TPA: lipopolysaccharide heptosyltransferase I [Rhodocyclaceae bacterium]|jgi:heptosyltransferase-1